MLVRCCFEALHYARVVHNIAVNYCWVQFSGVHELPLGNLTSLITEPQVCEITSRQSLSQDHSGLQIWVESLRSTTTNFM
jgi:hypothetical protein